MVILVIVVMIVIMVVLVILVAPPNPLCVNVSTSVYVLLNVKTNDYLYSGVYFPFRILPTSNTQTF